MKKNNSEKVLFSLLKEINKQIDDNINNEYPLYDLRSIRDEIISFFEEKK